MENISEADKVVKSGSNESEDVGKSEAIEVENVAKKSDRDDLHKRKNVKMSCGVYDNRLLRAIKNDDRRRSARYDRLSMKRQIPEDEELVLDDENKESLINTNEQEKSDNGNVKIPKENEENIYVVHAEINDENKDRRNDQEEVPQLNVASSLDKDSVEDPINVTFDTDGTLTSQVFVETVIDNSNNEDSIKESKRKEHEGNTPKAIDCISNINNSKIPVRISKVVSSSCANEVINDSKSDEKYSKVLNDSKSDKKYSKDVDTDPKLPNKKMKPASKAPTNDRREKLQQYLAEKKKLNQAKRRIEKPAFRPTGKIKYDQGPVGAMKPNAYSAGANNRQNQNGSFGSRQGTFGSRNGSCVSRTGSGLVRSGSNLSRKNLVVSRGGSTLSKGGSALSKNGSTFMKTNSNLARTQTSLSRSTLTMIR